MKNLLELLGAHFGWAWQHIVIFTYKFEQSKGLTAITIVKSLERDYSYVFKYWPATRGKIVKMVTKPRAAPRKLKQQFERRLQVRGRHWKRRRIR